MRPEPRAKGQVHADGVTSRLGAAKLVFGAIAFLLRRLLFDLRHGACLLGGALVLLGLPAGSRLIAGGRLRLVPLLGQPGQEVGPADEQDQQGPRRDPE